MSPENAGTGSEVVPGATSTTPSGAPLLVSHHPAVHRPGVGFDRASCASVTGTGSRRVNRSAGFLIHTRISPWPSSPDVARRRTGDDAVAPVGTNPWWSHATPSRK